MKCKITECDRQATYKKQQVCQKHYFRFMRYGTYSLTMKAAAKSIVTPNGYKKILDRNHILSDKKGYAYEHRHVFYRSNKDESLTCEFCGVPWLWRPYYDHVDHIDEDRLNNEISNLRPLCNSCNTGRTKIIHHESKNRISVTYQDKTMTPEEWSRLDFVKVKGCVIRYRIRNGWSVHDSLTKPSRKRKT